MIPVPRAGWLLLSLPFVALAVILCLPLWADRRAALAWAAAKAAAATVVLAPG